MNIKGFKLTSGEEIICHLHKRDGLNFVIENPVLIEWEISQNAVPTYDLLPWTYAGKVGHPIQLNVIGVVGCPYDIQEHIIEPYSKLVDNLNEQAERTQLQKMHLSQLRPRRVSKRKQ